MVRGVVSLNHMTTKKTSQPTETKKMSTGAKVAGVAGIAATLAGAYYLLGPNAKANQKKASTLLAKMKKEVQSEIKKAKDVTMPLYNNAVDAISEKYAKEYKAFDKEIKAFAKKLKGTKKIK